MAETVQSIEVVRGPFNVEWRFQSWRLYECNDKKFGYPR
jgi:hypothetical protein